MRNEKCFSVHRPIDVSNESTARNALECGRYENERRNNSKYGHVVRLIFTGQQDIDRVNNFHGDTCILTRHFKWRSDGIDVNTMKKKKKTNSSYETKILTQTQTQLQQITRALVPTAQIKINSKLNKNNI